MGLQNKSGETRQPRMIRANRMKASAKLLSVISVDNQTFALREGTLQAVCDYWFAAARNLLFFSRL